MASENLRYSCFVQKFISPPFGGADDFLDRA